METIEFNTYTKHHYKGECITIKAELAGWLKAFLKGTKDICISYQSFIKAAEKNNYKNYTESWK